MKSKTIETYNWFTDIQPAICKEMNIEPQYFRDYHKLIGGSYKDLWHEWLHYFDNKVRNDTTIHNNLNEDLKSKLEWIKEDGKEWLEPFVRAVYKIWNKYNIEYIRYCW